MNLHNYLYNRGKDVGDRRWANCGLLLRSGTIVGGYLAASQLSAAPGELAYEMLVIEPQRGPRGEPITDRKGNPQVSVTRLYVTDADVIGIREAPDPTEALGLIEKLQEVFAPENTGARSPLSLL